MIRLVKTCFESQPKDYHLGEGFCLIYIFFFHICVFHSVIHQKDPQDYTFTEIYYSKGYKAKAAGKRYALMGSREVHHRHRLPMSVLIQGHTGYFLSRRQLWGYVWNVFAHGSMFDSQSPRLLWEAGHIGIFYSATSYVKQNSGP